MSCALTTVFFSVVEDNLNEKQRTISANFKILKSFVEDVKQYIFHANGA